MPPKGEKLSAERDRRPDRLGEDGRARPAHRRGRRGKLTGLNDKARAHWAYQPVKQPAVPQVKDTAWVQDAGRCVRAGQARTERHDSRRRRRPKETLIRRATYDLIGLPPTPEEVQAFVNDRLAQRLREGRRSPARQPALRRAVGPLLARQRPLQRHHRRRRQAQQRRLPLRLRLDLPRLRHQGVQRRQAVRPVPDGADRRRPAARRREATPTRLAALGFLTVGKRFQNPNDTIDERIDTVSKATLALTVACARCHDHKFDPIPTADYYSLHGIFASTIEPDGEAADRPGSPPARTTPTSRRSWPSWSRRTATIYYDVIDEQVGASSARRRRLTCWSRCYGRKNQDADLLDRNKLIAENKPRPRPVPAASAACAAGRPGLRAAAAVRRRPAEQFAARRQGRSGRDHVRQGHRSGKAATSSPDARSTRWSSRRSRTSRPTRSRASRDVADVYGKLFAVIDAQGQGLSSRPAATRPARQVTGFDPTPSSS